MKFKTIVKRFKLHKLEHFSKLIQNPDLCKAMILKFNSLEDFEDYFKDEPYANEGESTFNFLKKLKVAKKIGKKYVFIDYQLYYDYYDEYDNFGEETT